MESTAATSEPVRIVVNLRDDYHIAGFLIPAGAEAAYEAAAEAAGVEIMFEHYGVSAEAQAWQEPDFDTRQAAYESVWSLVDCQLIAQGPVVDAVASALVDDWIDDDALVAILDDYGVDHSEADMVRDWALRQ